MMIRSGRERIAWKYLVVFRSDGSEEVSIGGTAERLRARDGNVFQAPEDRKRMMFAGDPRERVGQSGVRGE